MMNLIKKKKLGIVPNPANDFITLNLQDEIINKIEVYNVMGKKVKQFTNLSDNFPISVSDLSKGMYLVKVNDKYTQKLIVQ